MKVTQTISRQEARTPPMMQWQFEIRIKALIPNMASQEMLFAFRKNSEDNSQMLQEKEIIQWDENYRPQSRKLSLAEMDLGDTQLKEILGFMPEAVLKRITVMDLSHNQLTEKGLHHLLSQPLDALCDLNISFNTIDRFVPDQIEKLPFLLYTTVEHNQLTAQYILDISNYYPNVLKIKLHKNSSYIHMGSLANKLFPTIVYLDLSSNLLTDHELNILATARFPVLQYIDLSDNAFTNEAIKQITWNNYEKLNALSLSNCKLDDACIVSLAEQFTISHGKIHLNLRELNLSHNILTEKGHHALKQMYIPNLQNLWLHDPDLRAEEWTSSNVMSLYADTIRNFLRTSVYAELVSVAHSALEDSFSFLQQLLVFRVFPAIEALSNTEELPLQAESLMRNAPQQLLRNNEDSSLPEQDSGEIYCERLCKGTLMSSQFSAVLDTASPSSVASDIFQSDTSLECRRRHHMLQNNASYSSSGDTIAAKSSPDSEPAATSLLHIKNA